MHTNSELKQQAFSHKNIRLFVWFRVLFNCRFYYPVLAVFFVDLGLTLSQYIMLNVIWAATIVLLEVPSGALADLIGRKRLVVGSAAIMVAEMALLLFAPLNGGWLLFSLCAINRVLAGIAEAAASGADEALSYDSLTGINKTNQWDEVLAVLGRRSALCMAFVMISGALLYDSNTHYWLHQAIGAPLLAENLIIRIPVFLCFLQGIAALFCASQLTDTHQATQRSDVKNIVKQTLTATRWVWTTRAATLLLVGTMLIDATTRNYATLTSSYFRYINLPEYSFGFIGAAISLCGFAVPFYAKPLARKFGIVGNVLILASLSTLSLYGLSLFQSAWGILPAVLTMLCLYHAGFMSSRFLNKLASSDIRATVLSVKGLVFNMTYAVFSILFAQALTHQKLTAEDDTAFQILLSWVPLFLIGGILLLFLPCLLRSEKHLHSG